MTGEPARFYLGNSPFFLVLAVDSRFFANVVAKRIPNMYIRYYNAKDALFATILGRLCSMLLHPLTATSRLPKTSAQNRRRATLGLQDNS